MKRITLLVLPVIGIVTGSIATEGVDARVRRDIVVRAETPATVWQAHVARQLSQGMRYPKSEFGGYFPQGYTHVRFKVDDSGRPTQVSVARRSGARSLDLAAMNAVERLDALPSMPQEIAGRTVEAHLFFALSKQDLDDMQKADRARMAKAEVLAANRASNLLVLSVGTGPVVGSAY